MMGAFVVGCGAGADAPRVQAQKPEDANAKAQTVEPKKDGAKPSAGNTGGAIGIGAPEK